MQHSPDFSNDYRVLVVAPFGQDAGMAQDILVQAGIATKACSDVPEVCHELRNGGGALLIAYEALAGDALATLRDSLNEQPAWSDIPVFVFMPSTASAMVGRANGAFESLGNVTLVERPVRIAPLVSSLKSALRARGRQYLVRDLMEELRKSNQTKDAFVAAVSHELRTPLTAILGWAGMLKRAGDPARAATAVDVIERNAHVLSQLVEDLLDVARVATGRFRLNPASVDMRNVVTSATDAVRPTADAKNVRLELAVPESETQPEGALTVHGDAVRLQQVVWNLVWNAVKFTADGGVVQVGMSIDGRAADDDHARQSTLEIVVTDTGAGIAPNVLPHVFEPFRQGTGADGGRKGGLGLGLAITKHLVELHGGSVSAHSDGIGRGARFTVRLPSLAGYPTAVSSDPSEESAATLER
jgi:signal transduction histidine kinase